MMFKMKSMPFAVSCAIAGGALLASVPALAQSTAPEGATSSQAAPQRVVVTGSLISRTDTETAAPVQVLTAQDLQRSGKTSVAELLSDLAANGAGTLGTGFSGAFANGASGVSLRGLSVGSTLVLIDGHRMSPYAIGDDGERSFVDVSNIPFDAIDSIEVLKSGASSLYGSDAVAGVVNIKLKKSFNGTQFKTEAGNSQHGGGKTQRASISTGIGDLDNDGYNAFVTAEWRHEGAIKESDRDQYAWDNRDWRSRGGNNLTLGVPTSLNNFLTPTSSPFLYNPTGQGGASNPANFQFLDSSCNFVKYRAGQCAVRDTDSYLQPQSDNINVLLGMTKKLSGDWELAFKGSLFGRTSDNNRGVPTTYSTSSFAGNTIINYAGQATPAVGAIRSTTFAPGAAVGANVTNPFAPSGYVSPTNVVDTGRARLYGYIPDIDPNSSQHNRAQTTRFALDLHGSAWGWDTSIAGGITQSRVAIDYSGYINRPALYSAINSGQWNVLGGNDPSLVAQVSPTFSNTSVSKLNYFDASGSRTLMDNFMAGPLALAAGVHWHKRTWDSPSPDLLLNGTAGGTSAFVFGSETDTAIFGELQATPLKNTEVHLSSRYDHYDTYGNSFTPAASFKWTPVQQFALRGNFARGFRAPNPAETASAGSVFLYNAINDPILCPSGKTTTAGSFASGCGIQPAYVQQTNKNLSPEKSKSYDLGIVLEPLRGLNATLDYYKIQVNNQIVTSAGNDPNYTPVYVRGAPTPIDMSNGDGTTSLVTPPAGPILYANSPYINLGETKTAGIEADVNYRWRMPSDLGTLRADLSAAHTFSYEQSIGGTTYELAGTQGPSVVSGATGNPKDRAQFSLDWVRGPLDVTLNVNYTSSFSTKDPSVGGTDCASTALDVGGRTYFQGLTQPANYCEVSSFTATNLNVQYKLSDNLTLKGSILNLFDRQPPIDVGTYGNSGAQTSYNASLHQAGAVGRFFSAGLNYTF
ncbi:TonB-dependent receptor domain-containing protein [Massilia sp. 9096]|uniref:TonB-dependent receptor domain-containing protein n=1 Tax=Massilia sp. 9096 TaxID=1500894 RepID=UPI000A767375|nr:TonB-dependent receptor [Massilia sp. 9096]